MCSILGKEYILMKPTKLKTFSREQGKKMHKQIEDKRKPF